MSRRCLCGGFCPAHAPHNRFSVFYWRVRETWAVLAPHGTGKGKMFNTFDDAIAYADREARLLSRKLDKAG